MNTMRSKSSRLLAAVLALPAVLGGCSPLHTGNDIQTEQVKKIEPGKTTKQELLTLFGAPMGIAIQNETMAVLAPSEWKGSGRLVSRRSYEVQGDTLFELFSVQHSFTDYDRVYYFYDAKSSVTPYFCLVYIHEDYETEVDRLWVLMNEKNGIVEDYVYREHTHVQPQTQTQGPTPEAAPPRSVW